MPGNPGHNFWVQKFYWRKRLHFWQKSHSALFFFSIYCIECNSTTQITTMTIYRENFWPVNWGKTSIGLRWKAASNWLIFNSREINQLYFCPLPPWVQFSCNIGFTFWMQVSLLLSLHCICVKSKTGTTRCLFGRMYMWASMRLGWHCHAMFWCTCLKQTSTPHKPVIPDTTNAFRQC